MKKMRILVWIICLIGISLLTGCNSFPKTLSLFDNELELKNLVRIEIHPTLGRLVNLNGDKVNIRAKQKFFLPSGIHKFDFSNITSMTGNVSGGASTALSEIQFDLERNFIPNSSWLIQWSNSRIEVIYLGKLVADEGDYTVIVRSSNKSKKLINVYAGGGNGYRGVIYPKEEIRIIIPNYDGKDIPIYCGWDKDSYTYTIYSWTRPNYIIKKENFSENKILILQASIGKGGAKGMYVGIIRVNE